MSITCAEFEEIVHELVRPGTGGSALQDEALAHGESCHRCGVLLDKIMSLDFALDSLAVQEADERAPARVEAALIAEFRRQHAAAGVSRRWNSRVAIAALAMTAAVLLAVALVVPRLATRSNDLLLNSAAGPAVRKTLVAPAANGANTAAVQENSVSEDAEYSTNFVSLPYADDPGTLEGGTVVRVTLSRAALASFGVPVADISSTERIPADIALSEDGVPQAIRLVASANLNPEN